MFLSSFVGREMITIGEEEKRFVSAVAVSHTSVARLTCFVSTSVLVMAEVLGVTTCFLGLLFPRLV